MDSWRCLRERAQYGQRFRVINVLAVLHFLIHQRGFHHAQDRELERFLRPERGDQILFNLLNNRHRFLPL